MEPNINGDLNARREAAAGPDPPPAARCRRVPVPDLDGVPDDADCTPNSNFAPTVVIDGCDSGVPNTFFASG